MSDVDSSSDWAREKEADYQAYSIEGDGRTLGKAMASRIRPFGPPLEGDSVEFAHRSREVLSRYHPPLLTELESWSEGFDLGPGQLLWYLTLGASPVPSCSTVGLMARTGPLVFRNYDFFYFADTRHLITTHPGKDFSHLGMFDGLMPGRMDGVNSHGLWVSINAVGTVPPQPLAPGLSFHVAVRVLLETCQTAGEARDWLLEAPLLAGNNYFLADPHEMMVVEAHPSARRVRHPREGILAATNHYQETEMKKWERSPVLENSQRRYARLVEGGHRALQSPCPIGEMEKTMRDHEAPLCGHTDGLATFWSARVSPARKEIFYSLGAPCRNQYRQRSWPGD